MTILHLSRACLFTLTASSLLATSPGVADSRHAVHNHDDHKHYEQQAIREAVARGEVLPLPRILVIAQKAVPGDIIDVELEQKEWGLKYELKILTAAGRVRKVDINARTGAIVKIGDD